MNRTLCLFLSLCFFFFPLYDVYAEGTFRNYVLACPFQTVTDDLSLVDLSRLTYGFSFEDDEITEIIYSPDAAADLSELFPLIPEEKIVSDPLDRIRKNDLGETCAVVPIDDLNPTMKVISIGEAAFPWDHDYTPDADPLAAPSSQTNFDRKKTTTILLTGTTAFARTVAYKMMTNGTTYPAELIKPVFDASDITHISNESTIWEDCPEPRLDNQSLQFCSNSNTWELLDYLDVDIIELSGNHLKDFDWMPFDTMLNKLDDENRLYYAAGHTPEEAAQPLFITHNGNRFVFLGCNSAGPEHVFADEWYPGVNKCNFGQLESEIISLRDDGYIPIVTLQYFELYIHYPSEMQEADFQRLSDAGAVVVSGSQAHLPQSMKPMKDRFIHYGLGNLFFDQMDIPVEGTSQEFLDRYVFYDGRLLNVQLITARLTDWSRPQLMDRTDRAAFLKMIFDYMQ